MPSASSPVKDTLQGYLAGRVTAERLVITLATAYYGRDGARGTRDGLGSLIEVIDRASPGIVELGRDPRGAGFGIRLAERPFPQQHEAELQRAVQVYLAALGAGKGEGSGKGPQGDGAGWLSRLGHVLRRLFSG